MLQGRLGDVVGSIAKEVVRMGAKSIYRCSKLMTYSSKMTEFSLQFLSSWVSLFTNSVR